MNGKLIKWTADSQEPRRGPRLVKGETYAADLWPADVVEEWIKTGAAEVVSESKKKAVKPAEEV